MTELLLHVGMDKTGSSSIQRSFQGYDDGTLAYARLAAANHSMPVQSVFKTTGQPSRAMQASGMNRQDVQASRDRHVADFRNALDGSRQRILVSAEGVLALSLEEMSAFRDFLLSLCSRVRVFAYIREPMSYASSAFQQSLKAGGDRFRIPLPRYANRLGKVRDVFGSENVTFLLFAPGSFPGGSVVRAFSETIGADASLLVEQHSNQSFTRDSAAALFLFNRRRPEHTGTPELFRARLRLVQLLLAEDERHRSAFETNAGNLLGSQKFRLASKRVRNALDEEDVLWMEKVSGFSLMPSDDTVRAMKNDGMRSAKHILEVAASAKPYIEGLADRMGLRIRGRTTLAAMDTIFDHLLQGC